MSPQVDLLSPQAVGSATGPTFGRTRTPMVTAFSRIPVDNVGERLWTSCGRDCGESRPTRGCGGLWRAGTLIHSNPGVVHSVVHTPVRVPTGSRTGSPQFPQSLLRG